jgi:hypothetical protein
MPANTTHPVFQAPSDQNVMIWRYMDFTKYVSLLESKGLFFARSDRLGDPFEGSFSKANIARRPEVYNDLSPENFNKMFDQVRRATEWYRYWTYMNCWHVNTHESAAMWRLYAYSNEAIAIQSTYARLCQVLPKGAFVGLVQYIDYERDWLPEGNSYYPFVHKRKSFEHERELRAVIQDLPRSDRGIEIGKPNPQQGISVPISVSDLITQVSVAPTAADWFRGLVGKVTTRYGYNFPVTRSSLDERPVY